MIVEMMERVIFPYYFKLLTFVGWVYNSDGERGGGVKGLLSEISSLSPGGFDGGGGGGSPGIWLGWGSPGIWLGWGSPGIWLG